VRRFVWLVALLVVGVSAGLVAQDLRIRLRRINNHTPPSTFTATWTVNSTGPITMGLVAPEGSLAAGELVALPHKPMC
jgi:fluoride ion exporter CrcB/FEX